jgi:3-hydroxyacyl-[acyl-carrier-protein] dehydratase
MTEPLQQHEIHLAVPLSHPCYDGHFPGRPILPGVVLLELVAAGIGRGSPRAILSVKFTRALSPGQSLMLRWRDQGERVDFRCEVGTERVAEGVLAYA